MKIPKTIKIKGKPWSIEYKWRLHDETHGLCDGLCDPSTRTIFLDRLLPKEDKPTVFLHELIHAILHEAHLHEAGGVDGFVEEAICSSVADCFMDLFELKLKRSK